jgi:hypothetical protein
MDEWQSKQVSDADLADELVYLFELGYQIKSGE